MYLLYFIGTLLIAVHCDYVMGSTFESGWFTDILPLDQLSADMQLNMRGLVPDYLFDLYEDMRYQDDGLDPTYETTQDMYEHGQTIRSFRLRRQRASHGIWGNISRDLKFNLTGLPRNTNVTAAEFVLPVKNYSWVSERTRVLYRNVRLQEIESLHGNRRYLVYNISRTFIVNQRNGKIWLKVAASHFLNTYRNVLTDAFDLDKALVIVYENIDPHSLYHARTRRKRQVSVTFSNSFSQMLANNGSSRVGASTVSPDSPGCGLRPWHIDFSSLSWYWIVQPTNYYPNQCSGECMSSIENINSNYGIVKSRFHMSTGFQHVDTVALPTCTPSRLSAISILYYSDTYELISKRLPEMKVTQCDCR